MFMMIRFKRCCLAVALLCSFFSIPAYAVIYVDADATGSNNGSSWSDAYTALEAALAATSNDEIWVAAGTYKPAGQGGARTATFNLKNGVAVYGGFVGGETDRVQRDPAANATVLSGDLNGDDYSRYVNGHLVYSNAGDNSHHVVTASGVDASAVLDGFTIEHGYARPVGFETVPIQGGGGILITDASPTLTALRFDGSSGAYGGAAYIANSSPVFSDCEFVDNSTDIGWGGAVYSGGSSVVTFNDCRFTGNAAIGSAIDPDGSGGAIYNDINATLVVRRSIFMRNLTGFRTYTTGGTPTQGGAIMALGDVTIEDSLFLGNNSHNGGAVYAYNGFSASNTVFSGNKANAAPDSGGFGGASGYGGALVLGGPSVLSGVSMSDNVGAENGGGIYITAGNVQLGNSLLWNNQVTKYIAPGEDPIPAVKMQVHNGGGSLGILYSDVMGLLETIPGQDPPNPDNFPGSIDADPLFADADGVDDVSGNEDDDLRLTQSSPAIDAGDNDLVLAGTTLDLDGNTRRVDDPVTPDTGAGTAPIVDMGAYEFASSPPANLDPVAAASAAPTNGTAPLDVSFDSTDSSDSDGSIVGYAWDFGDGNGSSEANPSHTYTGTGSFTATLTVTDDQGASSSDNVVITVASAPDPGQPPAAPADLVATDGTDGTSGLSWTDNSNNETAFEIERSSLHPKNGKWTGLTTFTVAADLTTYSDSSGSGTFRYRMRAVNDSGASAWTNYVQVTVTDASGGGGGGGGKPCRGKKCG